MTTKRKVNDSRYKVLAVLAAVDYRGMYAVDVAHRARIGLATLRRVIANDDGTIRVDAGSYMRGRDYMVTLSAYDKLSLKVKSE